MYNKIISVIFLCFFLSSVLSINIEGPPKVRYRPCGSGPLHFDKINETYWKGFFDLGGYSSSGQTSADAVITFKEDNIVIQTVDNDAILIEQENRSLNIFAELPIDEPIVFDVTFNRTVNNSLPAVEAFFLNGNILCDSETVWASQMLDNAPSGIGQNNGPVCGKRSLDHEEIMTLRTEAKDEDWPWHVALLRNNKYFCGGTIVSKTAVITSGWCAYYNNSPHPITVVAGTSNLTQNEQPGRQILNATEIILPPGYTTVRINNIAIIKVNEFIFTKYVQPICVYGPEYDKTSLIGKEAVVVGFGGTVNPSQFGVLRSIDTTIRSYAECKQTYDSINIVVNEFHFCGGFGETSNLNPYHSDPGSGLIVSSISMDHKVTWSLRGVFILCYRKDGSCHPNRYALYTDVAPYYAWILYHSR